MTARLARLTRTTMAALIAFVALVAGGTTAAIATTSALTTTTITLTGTISDPSGYPLANIKILLFKDGTDEGTLIGTTTTNSAGRYRFTGVQLVEGDTDYRLEATDGSGAHVFRSSSLNVGSGTTTTHNVTMLIAGFIQGKVSTQDGDAPAQPAKHVYVTAYGANAIGEANVSARGKFRIGGLPAGKYFLAFQGDAAFRDQCYSNILKGTEGCEGTTGATQVTVTAGQATTITPQVLNHPTSTLGGTVTDTSGNPVAGASIAVYTATKHMINDTSYTKADGTWSMRGIAYVGKVRIFARDSNAVLRDTWYRSAVDFAHATPVSVTEGSELTTLRISMPKK